MFLIKAYATSKGGTGEGVWRTINGTPVFIQNGRITKGPAKLVGSTPDDVEGSKKSLAEKKKELQEKAASRSAKEKKEEKSSDTSYKEKYIDKTSDEIRKELNTSKMTDEQLKKGMEDTLNYTKNNSFDAKWRDSFAEHKAYEKELKSRNNSRTATDSSNKGNTQKSSDSSKKTTSKDSTSTPKNSAETFTVDGVKYEFKINSSGEGVITKDGGSTLVGINKSFKSVNDAKNMVTDVNARTARMQSAETLAKTSGGVALYTGKVIQPGSVKQAGVDPKTRQVQYTAVDHTGKTIALDSADMGAVLVSGLDGFSKGTSQVKTATPSAKSNFSKTVSSASTTKTTSKPAPAKASNSTSKGNPYLSIAHYDTFSGSRNEYRLRYADGSSKRISAKEAKQMFPDDPFFKKR